MPYTTSGKCVYKKKRDGSRGEKVGCTDGSVKKYLAALYANVDEKLTKENKTMKISKAKLRQIILEELRNYYDDLDLNDGQPTDDVKLIKKTYRQKALQNHPDRGGDVEKMQKINVAGQTLLDPAEKAKHDAELYRHAIEFKKQKPEANFDARYGLNLSDESLKKLADMAGISEPPADNIDFANLQHKIRQGIYNRFMDVMKQGNYESAMSFKNIYDQVNNIRDGDFKALERYYDFAKFA